MKTTLLSLVLLVLSPPASSQAQALIFADSFESGDTSAWSVVVGVPLDGFGQISGACGFLNEAIIDSDAPSFFSNAIDFANDPYDDGDFDQLTVGGQEIISDAGGAMASVLAEVFAYEVLARCESASLLKTGTEIVYLDNQGKKTDLLVEVDLFKLGINVTRAVAFPFEDPYTVELATNLLVSKLGDIDLSSANVAPEDAWRKQVLAILAYAPGHKDSLETAWDQLDAAVKGDTIVIVTVTNGDDGFLY